MRVGSFLLSKWAFKSRGVCTKCIEGSNPKPLCPYNRPQKLSFCDGLNSAAVTDDGGDWADICVRQ